MHVLDEILLPVDEAWPFVRARWAAGAKRRAAIEHKLWVHRIKLAAFACGCLLVLFAWTGRSDVSTCFGLILGPVLYWLDGRGHERRHQENLSQLLQASHGYEALQPYGAPEQQPSSWRLPGGSSPGDVLRKIFGKDGKGNGNE